MISPSSPHSSNSKHSAMYTATIHYWLSERINEYFKESPAAKVDCGDK